MKYHYRAKSLCLLIIWFSDHLILLCWNLCVPIYLNYYLCETAGPIYLCLEWVGISVMSFTTQENFFTTKKKTKWCNDFHLSDPVWGNQRNRIMIVRMLIMIILKHWTSCQNILNKLNENFINICGWGRKLNITNNPFKPKVWRSNKNTATRNIRPLHVNFGGVKRFFGV